MSPESTRALAEIVTRWATARLPSTVAVVGDGFELSSALAPLEARGVTVALEPATRLGDRVDVMVDILSPAPGEDWQEELRTLGRMAARALIVAVPNPAQVPARARRWASRDPGGAAAGDTLALAPILWAVGRVKEHVFLGAPTWAATIRRIEEALSPVHAFVVDTTPRTRQAKRRLERAP